MATKQRIRKMIDGREYTIRYLVSCKICGQQVIPIESDNHWKDGLFCCYHREKRNQKPKVIRAKARSNRVREAKRLAISEANRGSSGTHLE